MNITSEAAIVLRRKLAEAQEAWKHERIGGGTVFRLVEHRIGGAKNKVVHVPADKSGGPLLLECLGTKEDRGEELENAFVEMTKAIRQRRLTASLQFAMVKVPVPDMPGTFDFYAADANGRKLEFLGAVRGNPNITDFEVPLAAD